MLEEICLGHLTNCCPHCTRDEYNINCENYKGVRLFVFYIEENVSESHISNRLKLLEKPNYVQKDVEQNRKKAK